MTASEIVIGIDLDNTLVCYDELFHRTACEERLIETGLPKNKATIRDTIRLLPAGESQWTRLQAMVYGPRMTRATLFEGADVFLQHCAQRHISVKIVSHKTRFARLDDRPIDLRQAAREWLKAKVFFTEFGLLPGDVFFESTRAAKLERIRSLRCTHFIDDLAEVFAEPAFPPATQKLLFVPHGTAAASPETRVFTHWSKLDRFFFHDDRA